MITTNTNSPFPLQEKPNNNSGFFHDAGEKIKNVISAVDSYTKPRPETTGNIKENSYFLGCSVSDGLSVLGVKGLLGSVAAPIIGTYISNKTGKPNIGILAGAGVASALGVCASIATGCPMLSTVVFSGLLGAYETYRGNPSSETRDSASGANILNAPFIHGPLKLAGGIGAAAGTKVESKIGKAIVGAAVAGTIAAVVASIGLSPVSLPVAVSASVLSGALGPTFGPRFSQFFRNLSNDIGKGIGNLADCFGHKKEKDTKALNMIGAVPSSIIKESLRTCALSDGNLFNIIFASLGEAIKQSFVFYKQIKPDQTTSDKKPGVVKSMGKSFLQSVD